MIEITRELIARAIERARALHPKVRIQSVPERCYSVFSARSKSVYTVRFSIIAGRKFASCNCAAGEAGMPCYHIADAAAANIACQSARRQAAA